MRELFLYRRYLYLNATLRVLCEKLTGESLCFKRYAGKTVFTPEAGNDYIRTKIKEGLPFMAGRFGAVAVGKSLGVKLGHLRELEPRTITDLCQNGGFFPPTQEAVIKFSELIVEMCQYPDLLIVWGKPMEDYIVRLYSPNAQLSRARALEPYYHRNPWSQELKGKRVLVIHPFEQTIKRQYKKRELLFADKNILPEFELKTLKAVQTVAGQISEFSTWFDALEFMVNGALKIDFDVAIIGCGVYSFPLAAKLRAKGKQVVQMGGATQILFGIKGKRWDTHPLISKLYNKHWVRPLPEETPEKNAIVEGGCYW